MEQRYITVIKGGKEEWFEERGGVLFPVVMNEEMPADISANESYSFEHKYQHLVLYCVHLLLDLNAPEEEVPHVPYSEIMRRSIECFGFVRQLVEDSPYQELYGYSREAVLRKAEKAVSYAKRYLSETEKDEKDEVAVFGSFSLWNQELLDLRHSFHPLNA